MMDISYQIVCTCILKGGSIIISNRNLYFITTSYT